MTILIEYKKYAISVYEMRAKRSFIKLQKIIVCSAAFVPSVFNFLILNQRKERSAMTTIIQFYSLNTDVSNFVDFEDAFDFIKENYGYEAHCKNVISTDNSTEMVVTDITSKKMHPQLKKLIKNERLANYALVMEATNLSECIPVFGLPINQT